MRVIRRRFLTIRTIRPGVSIRRWTKLVYIGLDEVSIGQPPMQEEDLPFSEPVYDAGYQEW